MAEDPYSMFEGADSGFDTNLDNDEAFNRALTSHGRQGFGGTSHGSNRAPSTAFRPQNDNRPTTAITGANYKKSVVSKTKSSMLIEEGNEDQVEEEKIREIEKGISKLVDNAILTYSRGDSGQALEMAKSAARKERAVSKMRDASGLSEGQNMDLTFSVHFNVAVQYEMNELFSEALSSYQLIVKNKIFQNVGRIRVNMGNIHFRLREFSKSVKQYRMALDQVPAHYRTMRSKIQANIGACFIKLGQFQDASSAYEHIMSEHPDFKPGFNLVLCYYALRDPEKMRRAFMKLLNVASGVDDEKYQINLDDKNEAAHQEAIQSDSLRHLERQRRALAERTIVQAAKVIAPAIQEGNFSAGFDWCVSQVKQSSYVELANDLEIHKALTYLKEHSFEPAIKILKNLEKKDSNVRSQSNNNLSFIYFLQQKNPEASSYASKALQADKYNPSALVNKGNTVAFDGDWGSAIQYYQEALRVDAECTEALYNLGIACKRVERNEESLEAFIKLHQIQRTNPQVMFMIADIYRQLGDGSAAVDWLQQALSVSHNDPKLLQELGNMFDTEGDKSSAFQHHYDSYKLYPGDIKVIEWLASYYIESQFPEKAANYFARASVIDPHEVKWHLMNAACLRKIGNVHQSLEKYRDTHKRFPESREVLEYLVRLCSDMKMEKELKEYSHKLKKLDKMLKERETRETRITSAKATRVTSAKNRKRMGSGRVNSGRSRDTGSAKSKTSLDSRENSDVVYELSQPDLDIPDQVAVPFDRPKTSSGKRHNDDFDDYDDDDLLPE